MRTAMVILLVAAAGGCEMEWPRMGRSATSGGGSPVIAPQAAGSVAPEAPAPRAAAAPVAVVPAASTNSTAAAPVAAPVAAAPVVRTVPAAPRPVAPVPAPPAAVAVATVGAAPVVRPAGGGTLATVNGKPVPLAKLTDVLIAAFGMPVAKDVIYLELVEQAAGARGISVTEEDVKAEHERTLEDRFGKLAPKAEWEGLFWQMMSQHNVSRGHWMLICRRAALLRKLAPADIPVTDSEMHEAYGRLYGQKVQVRHIERRTMAEIDDVIARLAKGADFGQLAREVSISNDKEAGGLLPPFGRGDDKVPQALRSVAFSLRTPGTISSAIQCNETHHVLKLEKLIDPDVPFERVRDEVSALLRGEKVRVWGNRYLAELTKAADVEFVEPVLKAQYEQNLKALKDQAQQAQEKGKGKEGEAP